MSETLLGVIIGGTIAGLCGVITAFAQYCFDKWKRKQEKLDEIEKSYRQKKELCYERFISLHTLLLGFQSTTVCSENKKEGIKLFESIWGDELKTKMGKSFEILSNLSLFCDTDLAKKCSMFLFQYNKIDEKNFMSACNELDDIISQMRKDLGVK